MTAAVAKLLVVEEADRLAHAAQIARELDLVIEPHPSATHKIEDVVETVARITKAAD